MLLCWFFLPSRESGGVTFFMDWKPFALGKYERMKQGEECDIHGGHECFCWLEPFENEKDVICLYDLKNSSRGRI